MDQDREKVRLEALRLNKRYCIYCLKILSDSDFYNYKKMSKDICKNCFNARRREKYNKDADFQKKEKKRFKAYYRFKKLKNATK